MFPSNLHKSIVQLDRQISLLEKECESMEAESRKKNTKSEPMNCKSSRISNLQLKSPRVKVSVKKKDDLKKNKITPPRSSRVQSSSSVQSQCSKSWNDNSGSLIGRKTKSYGENNYLQGCTRQTVNKTQCNLKKDFTTRSSGYNGKHLTDSAGDEKIYENKKDYVLHKEVLIPNPGSTIEVIVTQKSTSKENSPVVKDKNLANVNEKNLGKCKCETKGPKWSEILHLESAKVKEMNNKNSGENQTLTGVKDLTSPSLKVLERNFFQKKNNGVEIIKQPTFEAPVKLSPELLRDKNVSEIKKPQFEEIQSCVENDSCEEMKNLLSHVETSNKNSPFRDVPEKSKINSLWTSLGLKNDFLYKLQQSCETLIREKEKLVGELTAKDNTLKSMKKREEEYISLITSLKSSLAKLQEQVQEDAKALKELNSVEAKLTEQKQITKAIKKRHIDLQCIFERCAMENHKLQTEIKLLKLESQKHDVLLAGKDAEINRYKDEIKNFQRQLSDHIELLKSNSQGLDAENMMETIMHQSQIFFQSNLNTLFLEDNQKESSKPNILMHSSPTSSKKSSVLNASWNAISSIHERDLSKGESDLVINGEEDGNAKEFFEIFGCSSSGSKSTEIPETLIDKLSDRKDLKNSCSFTSCVSLRDDSDSSDSKIVAPEKRSQPSSEINVNKTALRKVQSNIDELLKNLKSKWSKEIFESSCGDSTIKDFLNDSQISSITQ